MLEYITSFYSLAFIATFIGLLIIYIYDKFEKKQYTGANYFRFAILIYISTFLSLYLVNILSGKLGNSTFGLFDKSNITCDSNMQNSTTMQNPLSTLNEYSKMHLEQFKTGTPTF